jgi:putative ABC transport system permease protein
LRSEGRGATTGRERHLVRRALVFAEIALAVMLAAGAGLVVRTWLNVVRTDPGFEPGGLLTFQLSLPVRYRDRESRWRFYPWHSTSRRPGVGPRVGERVAAFR